MYIKIRNILYKIQIYVTKCCLYVQEKLHNFTFIFNLLYRIDNKFFNLARLVQ